MIYRKNPATLLAAAAFGLAALAPLQGFAQGAAKANVEKIQFEALPSPNINVGRDKNFRPKDWLEIEAAVSVQAAPVPPDGFLDRITVKWFIAVENPAGGRNATALLTRDVNYVNVPVDEPFYVSVYLSPSSVKRITGADRASNRVVKAVALQVLRNGVLIGQQNTEGSDGWWNSPTLGQMSGVPVLNKSETPFKVLWWDRYGEIEEAQR